MQSRARVHLVVLLACLASIASLVLAPRSAGAHTIGLSSGHYEAHGAHVDVELAIARAELLSSCPGLDRDADLSISPAELARAPDCLSLATDLRVTADGAACSPSPVDAALTEMDGALFRLGFTCPARPARFAVEDAWLSRLPATHKHVARAKGRVETDMLLSAKSHSFELEPADDAEKGAATPAAEARPSLFRLGVTHILGAGGLDHLAFLAGLVLVPGALGRRSARALLLAITAFSVGHTLSLGLSVSGVWVPSARLVEPMIALSIAWVGAENAFASVVRRRALVTLPFGFVHGFGFASSLREVMRGGVGVPLFTFNLGVEVGQVLAVLPMVALVYALDRRGLLGRRPRLALNVALLAGGAVLAVVRLADPS